jgi:hypothetical protein
LTSHFLKGAQFRAAMLARRDVFGDLARLRLIQGIQRIRWKKFKNVGGLRH